MMPEPAPEEKPEKRQRDYHENIYLAMRGLMGELLDDIRSSQMHEHHWETIGVNPPHGPRTPFAPTTTFALLLCPECGLPMSVELQGSWTPEQLGVDNGDSDKDADHPTTGN